MKWRAHKLVDGTVDQNVAVSDTHTIIRVTSQLFICFRKAKPMAKIIGRWCSAANARKCCECDHEGKPYPPDTFETYPPGRPALDSPPEKAVLEPTPGMQDAGRRELSDPQETEPR